MDIFNDWMPSITQKKNNLFLETTDNIEKDYPAYMINRGLSQHMDTVLQANEMNVNNHIDGRMQYDYLLHSVEKRKRYGKWAKGEKDELSMLVMEAFGVSRRHVQGYLDNLTTDDLEAIKEQLDIGGKRKSGVTK